MSEHRALEPLKGSKIVDQSESVLDRIWFQVRDEKKDPFIPIRNENSFVGTIQNIPMDDNVVLMTIPYSDMEKATKAILKQISETKKRIYIIMERRALKQYKEHIRGLAGNTLIRFTESPLRRAIACYPSRTANIEVSNHIHVDLDDEQTKDFTKWFMWLFWEVCTYEIATIEDVEKPADNLTRPIDPLSPLYYDNLILFEPSRGKSYESVPTGILCSSAIVWDAIHKENLKFATLNSIDDYENIDDNELKIMGYKEKVEVPTIIEFNNHTLLLFEFGNNIFQLKCNPSQSNLAAEILHKKGPYSYVQKCSIGNLNDETQVKHMGVWGNVKDQSEIHVEMEPIQLDRDLEKLKLLEPSIPVHPPLIKNITYTWEITPKKLPSSANSHKLVKEWIAYKEEIMKNIERYEKIIDTIISSAGKRNYLKSILDKLRSFESTANDLKMDINELKSRDWMNLSEDAKNQKRLIEIMQMVDGLWARMEDTSNAEERRIEEERQREEYEGRRNKNQSVIDEKKSLINQKKEELEKIKEKDIKAHEINKLEKSISSLETEIKALNDKNQIPFKFQPPEKLNKITGKKHKSESQYYKSERNDLPETPKQRLPQSGKLYSDNAKNYIVIERWDDLSLALKEAEVYNAEIVSYPHRGDET